MRGWASLIAYIRTNALFNVLERIKNRTNSSNAQNSGPNANIQRRNICKREESKTLAFLSCTLDCIVRKRERDEILHTFCAVHTTRFLCYIRNGTTNNHKTFSTKLIYYYFVWECVSAVSFIVIIICACVFTAIINEI